MTGTNIDIFYLHSYIICTRYLFQLSTRSTIMFQLISLLLKGVFYVFSHLTYLGSRYQTISLNPSPSTTMTAYGLRLESNILSFPIQQWCDLWLKAFLGPGSWVLYLNMCSTVQVLLLKSSMTQFTFDFAFLGDMLLHLAI